MKEAKTYLSTRLEVLIFELKLANLLLELPVGGEALELTLGVEALELTLGDLELIGGEAFISLETCWMSLFD